MGGEATCFLDDEGKPLASLSLIVSTRKVMTAALLSRTSGSTEQTKTPGESL